MPQSLHPWGTFSPRYHPLFHKQLVVQDGVEDIKGPAKVLVSQAFATFVTWATFVTLATIVWGHSREPRFLGHEGLEEFWKSCGKAACAAPGSDALMVG